MSHEIYYTSAPEGLRPATSGFCTVGASDNIPKPLWDRLESLSAYRHHFTTASGNPGENPVSFAHWVLSIAGVSYHVLSRVCDSGVDHTQRTNAFADHLVVENSEMTPAGPAWMLTQNALAESWDGQVRTLPPRNLPQGEVAPAICRGWQSLAGDAGWGGHLADIFVKSPTKPVCILFSPGQRILPLIAEAIALLPPTARWNVTFNTYFTSMPTSATCTWRCCLAGTPAAQLGMRYASGGIVIDLTDPSRLGPAPDGPYATLARTGIAPAAIAKNVTTPSRPVAGRPAAKSSKSEELAEFELAPLAEAPQFSKLKVIVEPAAPAYETPSSNPVSQRLSRNMEFIMRDADKALRKKEVSADQAAARRRKQFVYLFFGALAALAVGMTLVMIAMRNTSPPELPNVEKPAETASESSPVVVTPPKPATPAPIVPKPAPVPTPAPVVLPPIVPIPAPVPQPPPAPKFASVIKLAVPLKKPIGSGIEDFAQSIPFNGSEIDPASAITSIKLLFPPPAEGKAEYTDAAGPPGTIVATSESTGSRHKISIRWKTGNDLGSGAELLVISLIQDHSHSSVELLWRISNLSNNPSAVPLVYWVMQNCGIELQTARGAAQRIAFQPYEHTPLSLMDPEISFDDLPADIPRQVEPTLVSTLPEGWKVDSIIEQDKKNPVLLSIVSHGLRFEKMTGNVSTDPYFIVMFEPTFRKMSDSFSERLAAEQQNLEAAQKDVDADAALIKQYTEQYGALAQGKGMDDLLNKQAKAQGEVNRYNALIAGYNELKEMDISLAMPGGMRLVTFHLRRTKE